MTGIIFKADFFFVGAETAGQSRGQQEFSKSIPSPKPEKSSQLLVVIWPI